MNFTVQKQNIMAAMDIAIRVIPTRTTQPILECFLIEVDGTEGYITGMCGLQSLRTGFSCMAEESGKVCVEAKLLMNAIKKMGKGDITIKTEGNSLIISGTKARYEFPTRLIEEYPSFPVFGDATKIKVDAVRFGSMIDGVAFAVSQKDGNKLITGINLNLENGSLRLTALDMVRVAIRTCGIQQKVEKPINVTIPAETMISLAKSVSDGELEIEIGKLQVRFKYGSTTVVSRTYDGKYFNVDQMLGNSMPIKVKCKKSDIADAIDRAMVINQDNAPIVLDVTDDSIRISMKSNTSNFDEEVYCDKSGSDIRIGINPQYLLDAIRSTDEKDVTMEMNNPSTPLNVVDDVCGEYVHLVLPVSI